MRPGFHFNSCLAASRLLQYLHSSQANFGKAYPNNLSASTPLSPIQNCPCSNDFTDKIISFSSGVNLNHSPAIRFLCNRVLQQLAPKFAWQGQPVSLGYRLANFAKETYIALVVVCCNKSCKWLSQTCPIRNLPS